jgi:hypothetical protein
MRLSIYLRARDECTQRWSTDWGLPCSTPLVLLSRRVVVVAVDVDVAGAEWSRPAGI